MDRFGNRQHLHGQLRPGEWVRLAWRVRTEGEALLGRLLQGVRQPALRAGGDALRSLLRSPFRSAKEAPTQDTCPKCRFGDLKSGLINQRL